MAKCEGEGTKWTQPSWQCCNGEGDVEGEVEKGGVENLLWNQIAGIVSVTHCWDTDIS